MTKNEKAVPEKSLKEKTPPEKKAVGEKTAEKIPPEKKTDKKKISGKPRANWAARILVLLLIFIGGAATGLYFLPVLKERIPIIAQWVGQGGDLETINQKLLDQQIAIDGLSQKSAAQETRLNQLTSAPANDPAGQLLARIVALEESLSITPEASPPAQDTSQSSRIDMLLSRMSQLEASFIPLSKNMIDATRAEKERQALIDDNTGFAAKISNLESRLGAVEKIAAKDNSAVLLNFKIAELKRKLLSGGKYAEELRTVKTLSEKSTVAANASFNAALDYLTDKSLTGISTPQLLRRDFNGLIPDLLGSENYIEAASWWQNTLNGLKNMVTIRKTDGSSYSAAGLDGLITEIENRLNSSDFKSALEIITDLPEPSQKLLAEWKGSLEEWLGSEQALNELENIATENYLNTNPPVEAEL